jgi:aminopeptidase N
MSRIDRASRALMVPVAPWLVALVALTCALSPASAAEPAVPPGFPPPNLDPSEVLRLTEEATRSGGALPVDGKEGLTPSPGLLTPAATIPHAYDALHYRLDVTPSRTSPAIAGTMTLTLRVLDPALAEVDLHAVGLSITGARVNGGARTVTPISGGVLIPVCEGGDCPPHAPGDTLVLAVDYSGAPTRGLYTYARNTYTLSEPYDARRWWPCYDLPSDKATLDLYATVPDSNVCYSNGVLVSVTPAGPPAPAGQSVWHWRETHPIATYLVSLAVADYWEWSQPGAPVPLIHCTFPEDSTKAKLDFANVPAMFGVFAARWGAYPFDKYGQAAVSPFSVGGMEHQTMTTINRSWLRGDRYWEFGVAHELAHQWWGDWVTCVDFRNIWLNEGFATFGEAVWHEGFYGAAAYDAYIQAQMNAALAADANFRYALYDPPASHLFGTTIYKKGSVVLHMLRRVLGEASFDAGMRAYGQSFGFGAASTADFEQAMEDASGQPLDWFFGPWVYGQGLPTYQWVWQTLPAEAGASDLAVFVRQTQTEAPLFRMPIELRIVRAGGLADTTVTVWNEAVSEQNFVIRIRGTATALVFDPRNSIWKQLEPLTADAGVGPGPDRPGPRLALAIAPNPTRGTVTLTAGVAGSFPADIGSGARFSIYDAAGRQVLSRVAVPTAANAPGPNAGPSAGPWRQTWDLSDEHGVRVPAGLYFVEIVVGALREARTVIVLP